MLIRFGVQGLEANPYCRIDVGHKQYCYSLIIVYALII